MQLTEQHYMCFMTEIQAAVETALRAGQEKVGMPASTYLKMWLGIQTPLLFGRAAANKKLDTLTFSSLVACVFLYTANKVFAQIKDTDVQLKLIQHISDEQTQYDMAGYPVTPLIKEALDIQKTCGQAANTDVAPLAMAGALIKVGRGMGVRFPPHISDLAIVKARTLYSATTDSVARKIDLAVDLLTPVT